MVYAVNADEVKLPDNILICYQGSHGDNTVLKSSIVLPAFFGLS